MDMKKTESSPGVLSRGKRPQELPMRILVLGGARSGKSRYARHLAETLSRRPLFVATAEIIDDEMNRRVAEHRRSRGKTWRCIEEPLDIDAIIRNPPTADVVLVDCLTVWLGNVLHKEGQRAFGKRRQSLISAFCAAKGAVILVANEVGMGIVPQGKMSRQFRDFAGRLNQDLAHVADTVIFIAAGLSMVLKGHLPDGMAC